MRCLSSCYHKAIQTQHEEALESEQSSTVEQVADKKHNKSTDKK